MYEPDADERLIIDGTIQSGRSSTVGRPGHNAGDDGEPTTTLLDRAYGGVAGDGMHTKRHTPPFTAETFTLMVKAWRNRARSTPVRTRWLYALLLVVNWGSFMMMAFGMNWWIHSFPKDEEASSFLQMIVPAVFWAVTFLSLVPVLKWCVAPEDTFFFWLPGPSGDRRGLGLIIALGLVDALGGLTVIYAAANVVQFMQTMIYATGPFVTWALAKAFSPAQAPPMNPWLALTFVLSLAAICVASSQHAHEMEVGDAGWLFVFFLSSVFPNLYNVIQGRFLSHFSQTAKVSHWTSKLSVLVGDTLTQIVFTWAFFPLDSLPWFGSNSNPKGTWESTTKGLECMAKCEYNALYFALYVFGFVLSRMANAFINHHSPTLGAFIGQFASPLIALVLLAVPSWSVKHTPTSWYLQIVCLVLLLASSFVYTVYEEACRAHDAIERRRSVRTTSILSIAASDEEGAAPAPLSGDNGKQYGAA